MKLLLWVIGLILVVAFTVSPLTAIRDRDPNPRPTFRTYEDRLIADMDLTYCWSAVFTNEDTGLSHTLTTAYDKDGRHC